MFERIEEKIISIRQQPESVRMRYLFICLAVSMAFVVIIWLFSLKDMARGLSNTNLTNTLPALELNQQANSLESLGDKPLDAPATKNTGNEGNPLFLDSPTMNK